MPVGQFWRRLATAALAAAIWALAQAPAAAQSALTPEQWRQDLKTLAASIEKVHPHPFHKVSREAFEAAVADLDAKIPSLSDAQVEVGLMRIVALLGEGHTRVSLPGLPDPMSDVHTPTPIKDPRLAFHQLPVQLYQFSDGLFVTAATPEFKDLIGAQVVEIAGHPAAEVLDAVRPLINRDNDTGAELISPVLATIPEVLEALGLNRDPAKVALILRRPAGSDQRVALAPLPAEAGPAWIKAPARPTLSQSHPGEAQWAQYLPAPRTLYARINLIEDTPGQTIAQFASGLGAIAAAKPVDRFVIDLRGCHGGDNQRVRGLLLEVLRNPKLDRTGQAFVLIDRGVFSAAVNTASDLERLANVIFVGEPTAGAPNSWGDPRKITLPNSGLVARISTIYWRDWTTDESRPALAPDIATPLSSADFLAGRDPDMAAVMAFPARPSFKQTLVALAKAGAGQRAVLRLDYQHHTDPALAGQPTSDAVEAAAEIYVARRAYADAYIAFAINAHDDPKSVAAGLSFLKTARAKAPGDADLAALETKVERLNRSAP